MNIICDKTLLSAAIDGVFGAGSCHVLTVRNHGAIEVVPEL